MTKGLSASLAQLLQREESALRALPETKASLRPGGDSTWSPKEELGHLIDSAANNHLRFAGAAIAPEFHGAPYAQNEWVKLHGYQETGWTTIVDFWHQYNSFIRDMLARIPENKLQTHCFIGAGEGVSLQFLVEDYVLHMQHHIDHLLGRERVTEYPSQAPSSAAR